MNRILRRSLSTSSRKILVQTTMDDGFLVLPLPRTAFPSDSSLDEDRDGVYSFGFPHTSTVDDLMRDVERRTGSTVAVANTFGVRIAKSTRLDDLLTHSSSPEFVSFSLWPSGVVGDGTRIDARYRSPTELVEKALDLNGAFTAQRIEVLTSEFDERVAELARLGAAKRAHDAEVDRVLRRRARFLGVGLIAQWGFLFHLVFDVYSWDVMEPIVYFMGLVVVLGGGAFAASKGGKDSSYVNVWKALTRAERTRRYEVDPAFDLIRFLNLRDVVVPEARDRLKALATKKRRALESATTTSATTSNIVRDVLDESYFADVYEDDQTEDDGLEGDSDDEAEAHESKRATT